MLYVAAMTYLDTLLRSQLGKPTGLFGSLIVAPMLNVANRGLVSTAIELLAPAPTDAVLDVGFGGGASLLALARKVPRGKVTGIDYSRDMVRNAQRVLRERTPGSRVRVQWGDVADLPFADASFDRAVTINSLYYWPDLMAGLHEMARVLKPRGRLVVGYHSPEGLRVFTRNWDSFYLYEPPDLAARMREAGLHVLRIEQRDRWSLFDTLVIVAERR